MPQNSLTVFRHVCWLLYWTEKQPEAQHSNKTILPGYSSLSYCWTFVTLLPQTIFSLHYGYGRSGFVSTPTKLFHHRMDKRWKMSTKPQITNFHSMAVVFQNATTFTGGKNIGVEKHSTCNKRSAWTQLCPYSTKRRGMELDFVEKYNDQNFLS